MAIIKTLKTTTNDIEQSVYPKTILEAVVDAETNETLDVILDNLNEKIDNIEPGGGSGEDRVIDYRSANIFSFNKETTSVTYDKCHLDLVEGKLYFDVTVVYTTSYPGSEITITINDSELYATFSGGRSITYSNGGAFNLSSPSTITFLGGSSTPYDTHGYYGYYTIADTSKVGGEYTPDDILTKVQDSVDASLNSSSINPVQNKAVKKALDDQRSSLSSSLTTSINSKVSKSGDTMTGDLTVHGDIDNSAGNTIRTWDLVVGNDATIKGTITGNAGMNLSSAGYPVLNLTRTGTTSGGNYTAIQFKNDSGMLGGIAMNTVSGSLTAMDANGVGYSLLDSRGGTLNGGLTIKGGLTSTSESTILQQDYHCHTFAGGGGSTTGYIHFARIKTNNTYVGGVLKMTIHTRNCVGDLLIGFNGNSSETGANISYVKQTGNLPQIHIHKSATQTFDLYIYKMAYESCTVSRINTSVYMQQRTAITWSDTYASAVPSDAIAATKTNDWTTVLTSSGSHVVSLPLNQGSAYIISILTSTNMSYMLSATPTSTSFIVNTIGGGGSATYSVSGTTLTITFSGGSSDFSTTCKYIELK